MARFSLSALGADRPGIVAAVTGALVDLGCNMEDSTMTILRGHFAVLLVVAAPSEVTQAALENALAPAARAFDLTVAVRSLAELATDTGKGAGLRSDSEGPELEAWTIAVHGADRPGIVHAVTSALADARGNVVDLATHLVGDPDAPVYVMTLRATLPSGGAGEEAAERVGRAASALGVHCTMHRDEADLL
ncbi:MAG TPA: ACT domain-containing protein [Acidimicrobiales bacterium]|nr:ACT domain-containing protein [Acidimicrobiales bacterium]